MADKTPWLVVGGPGRIPALDGVRAIAIALVIIFHTYQGQMELSPQAFPNWLMKISWVGVQLFFTLSGFLIGGGIYEEIRKERFSLQTFYVRRFLRIVPPAYIFLVIYAWPRLAWPEGVFWNFLYLANYRMEIMFYGPFWSLCVEEHFYLVFPGLFLLLYRWCAGNEKAIRQSLIAGILITWLVRSVHANAISGSVNQIYYQTHIQADFFLFGVLIAMWPRRQVTTTVRRLIGVLILAGYPILGIMTERVQNPFLALDTVTVSIGYLLLSLWCFAVVWYGVNVTEGWLIAILSRVFMRRIATLSYSMYLWQYSGIDMVSPIRLYILSHCERIVAALLICAINIGATAAVALAAYLIIERPCLRLRHRFRPSQKREGKAKIHWRSLFVRRQV